MTDLNLSLRFPAFPVCLVLVAEQRHLGDLVRSARLNMSDRPSFGGVRWRFLVFAYAQEQLSKGKIHLTEAARLAKATNRILVLPRVSQLEDIQYSVSYQY